MGWLKKYLKDLAGSPQTELTFVPSVPAPYLLGIGEAMEPDSCYIELYLVSLRLTQARRFATRFHGIVYSFVTLPREGDENAKLAAVSKPEKLMELDKNSLDHVITVNKLMMGSTAFRGGPVSVELGLFSVKSGNLLTPLLDYITRVSSTAGISYVGAIKPFLPLITEGMDLIAGQQQDTALEVGIDTNLPLATSCVAAIIARPKESIDRTKLSLDEDNRLLLDGKPLECGYAVFSFRSTRWKLDYGEIPELKERYAAFQSAIKGGKKEDANGAFTAFRLAVIASPDLISSDADRLIQKAKKKLDEAFPLVHAAIVEKEDISPETHEKLSEAGRKGGESTKESHGREFYHEIGKKGGEERAREIREEGISPETHEKLSEAGHKGAKVRVEKLSEIGLYE